MEFHPAANLFPMFGEEELRDLAEDIASVGLLHPIVTHEGKILDGRNRYRACQLVGVQPKFREWAGEAGSPTSWVMSENLLRRHLTQSQRAMVGVAALPLFEAEAKERKRILGTISATRQWHGEGLSPIGDNPSPCSAVGRSVNRVAEIMGVAPRQITRAKTLAEKAPELAEQVKQGDITINAALQTAAAEGRIPIQSKPQGGRTQPKRPARIDARPVPRTLPGGRLPAPVRGAPIPADIAPRVRDFVEAFEDRLSIALCQKHPGLTSAQWDDVVLMMRERMLSLFEGYNLGRKPVTGTAEPSLRNGRNVSKC